MCKLRGCNPGRRDDEIVIILLIDGLNRLITMTIEKILQIKRAEGEVKSFLNLPSDLYGYDIWVGWFV